MSQVTLRDALPLLVRGIGFTSRVGLRAECFYRLSSDPICLGGLTPVERDSLLAARKINETHYMPFCGVCGERIDWDHKVGGLRTWLHVNEVGKDHVVEQASHPDSYSPHPDGLAYVVWSGADVLAWALNDGTVIRPTGTTVNKHRQLVHDTLPARLPARTS